MTAPILQTFTVTAGSQPLASFDSMAGAVAHRSLMWLALKEEKGEVMTWREFALYVRINAS